ncbi:MAG: NAD(P)-binding domain-containing protein [Candidatus Promineifilaceae bacterium]|nr:NAD(P)-binding domain-containing protein [Candidatus Promineifilaceae bacterium]
MKISVIGAGNIGGILGSKWANQGHEVLFGVRDPQADKVAALLASGGNKARAAMVPESIGAAEVVLFAVPANSMKETAAKIGDELNGKILIDATNAVGRSPMHQFDLLRETAPNSALFRAFSNLGWENFADPMIKGVQIDLFYCGDPGPQQQQVDKLIADIGLRPVYIGDISQAGIIDSLTQLWFTLALRQGLGRHLAFKLLAE